MDISNYVARKATLDIYLYYFSKLIILYHFREKVNKNIEIDKYFQWKKRFYVTSNKILFAETILDIFCSKHKISIISVLQILFIVI